MTLDDLHALQREDGRRLLIELATEPLTGDDLLSVLERYRLRYPPALVRAAMEQVQLRRRAAAKFPGAAEMFFTRDGLEMASSHVVAAYTAERFSGLPLVLDLCCGIGGDALALAASARRVIAVDHDPLALEMARANARAHRLHDRIDFVQAEVMEFLASGLALLGRPVASFLDPSRRDTPGAARRPAAYSPPLSWGLDLPRVTPGAGIKVSPALDYDAVLAGTSAEVEIISWRGECKEAVLWLGTLQRCARRATVLPGAHTLTENGPTSAALGNVGSWLYEPDAAVIRAHLVQRLAGACGLRRIDPDIAYLTGDERVDSPFLHGYPVVEVLPWSLKGVNAALRARGIGQVTIKKRGFPLTPEELRPKLKLAGSGRAVLVCTRAAGKPVVIFTGERVGSALGTASGGEG